MAGFSNFFPDDTPRAVGGQTYNEGDLVFFEDNVYACTATDTLSATVVATDFDTNWVLLSGGDASAIDNANDAAGAPDDLKFWSGTREQYDAITTPASDTIYYITDEAAVLGTFLGLEDTPSTYGTPGQVAVVNDDADGLVFMDQSGGGGTEPTIDSITFINAYTGTESVTPTGANHGFPGEINYIEIAGSNFIQVGSGMDAFFVTVEIQLPGMTMFETAPDLIETRLSNNAYRVTLPASESVLGTSIIRLTNGLGGQATFEIQMSAGPSLTSKSISKSNDRCS